MTEEENNQQKKQNVASHKTLQTLRHSDSQGYDLYSGRDMYAASDDYTANGAIDLSPRVQINEKKHLARKMFAEKRNRSSLEWL